jgi:hypothetical protein
MGEGLAMHGLYYADEVRNFADIEIDTTIAIKDAELELAKQLIDQLSHDKFQIEKYEDEYRRSILEAVNRKVAGEEIVITQPEEAREQIIDLVAALKKSSAWPRRPPRRRPSRRAKPPRRRGRERRRARLRGVGRQLSTADAARILGLSEARIRELVRSGLCRPARAGRSYAFSFQELVVLRTAAGLLAQNVPMARVRRALAALMRELPAERPLSGLRIFADGKRVAVRDGGTAWEPETGQTLPTSTSTRWPSAWPSCATSTPPRRAARDPPPARSRDFERDSTSRTTTPPRLRGPTARRSSRIRTWSTPANLAASRTSRQPAGPRACTTTRPSAAPRTRSSTSTWRSCRGRARRAPAASHYEKPPA